MSKTKILIAGLGGVGGYFGGLLAKHYFENDNIEISFLARGEHLKQIKANGLKVIKGQNEFVAKPHLVTDIPSEIGITDFIIISCKSYDLGAIMQDMEPCINKNTILLPLLNGVDSKEKIKPLYHDNCVLDGCVYIVSRLKQFGVIENTGNIQTLYFGQDDSNNKKLEYIEEIFTSAGIEATLCNNISKIIWEKFIFISATASATSYFDNCIGDVLSNSSSFSTIKILIEEIIRIATAKGIIVREDIAEITLNKLRSLPYETTSSMHSDFKNNKINTELEALCGYVISEGLKYNLSTPTYSKIYTALKNRGRL